MRKGSFLIISLISVLLLTSLLNFGPNIQTVKADPYFSDNFNDGVADGWTPRLGSWNVINGEYFVSVGIVENGISTVNGLNLTDCVIETQLRFTDSVGYEAGIVFRYLDNAHYYAFQIGNEYDHMEIITYDAANPDYGNYAKRAVIQPLFGNNSIPIDRNVNYTLRIEIQGTNFNAYFNGQHVLSWTDNSYSSGLVGLRARRADVYFDNFKIGNATAQPTPTPTPTPTPSPVPIEPNQFLQSYSDDFNTNSDLWQYLGNAYRDQTNQYLVLTESTYEQGGVAFFNIPFKSSFTANFSYKVGGGSGGDGFTMFFYKQKFSTIGSGGNLGFNSKDEIAPGYGIEFDGWQNIAGGQPSPPKEHGDPSANHIALIKDYVGNHLIHVNDPRTEDNNWHMVTVDVQESSVRVFVDQGLVLQWNGALNKTYDGFGFSGATGRSGTNWHLIDNFSITFHSLQKPLLTLSCKSSTSYSGFDVQVKGSLTFNGTGILDAPILLSYSVTGGKSWQDLTLVNTGSDGSYSAVWMPSVTGNYMVKATYDGDAGYPGTTEIVNFAVTQFAEKNVFSVSSNSTVSSLVFNSESRELSFTVTGESGTTGYIDMYIAKSIIGDIANVKAYLDGAKIDYTATSVNDSWLLHFSYQHSTHEVLLSLGPAPTAFSLDSPLGLGIVIGAILIVILAGVLVALRKRKASQSK